MRCQKEKQCVILLTLYLDSFLHHIVKSNALGINSPTYNSLINWPFINLKSFLISVSILLNRFISLL